MKFPKISQSEINTLILLGIVATILLATLSYFNKQREGLSNDWELTTDDGDVALQYQKNSALKVSEDGTIENATIDKLIKRMDNLEARVDGTTTEPGETGEAGEAGAAGAKGEVGPAGPAGKVPDMAQYVKQSDLDKIGSVPVGTIVAFNGKKGDIPTGWAICDGETVMKSDKKGTIKTPNLTNKFIMATVEKCSGAACEGGGKDWIMTQAQMAKHTHTWRHPQHFGGANSAAHPRDHSKPPYGHTKATGSAGSSQPIPNNHIRLKTKHFTHPITN